MTDDAASHRAASSARHGAGLLAGLLLLDIVLNVPLLAPAAPIASLLAPSLDLLVLVACGMAIAQAGTAAQRGLRAGLALLAMGFLSCEAGLRFGWDAGGRLFGAGSGLAAAASWAACVLLAVAAGLAAFALSRLVIRGMEPPLSRSLVLLAVSLAVVLQVASGHRLFAPSVIPRLLSLIR